MKKLLNLSAITFCLCFFQVPYSYCQDNKKEKTTKETNADDADDEGDIPGEEKDVKKKKKSPSGGHAHAAFGIEAGLNMAKMNVADNDDVTFDYKAGGRAGIIIDIPVSNQFYIQPGIFYAMNGVKSNSDYISYTYSETLNMNTIEVPVNLIYKFGQPGSNRFFVGTGPYIGYNISATGKAKTTDPYTDETATEDYKYKIGSDEAKDDFKAIDFGIGINAGYELANGLFFRARYQGGLSNLSPQSGATIRASSIGLQVGYLFGHKAKHKKVKVKDDDYVERRR